MPATPLPNPPTPVAPETPAVRAPRPYADAPKLPDHPHVLLSEVVAGVTFELEIGPGRGGFIQERASGFPDVGILGLEVRRKWASIVDGRLKKAGVGARARVLAEDAKDALPRLGPDGSVAVAYLHFPDPWWKKRHQKRLVLEPAVVDHLARLLRQGGELFVQTDVAERAAQYEELLTDDKRFEAAGDAVGSARLAENPYEARSPRERRAIVDGLPIYRVRFRRRGA